MPLSQNKVTSIIMQQSKEIEERCDGYREEIVELLCQILELERLHKIAPRSIQKLINEQCTESGNFLAVRRNQKNPSQNSSEGEIQ